MRLLVSGLLAFLLPAQTISTLIGTGSPGFDERSVNNPYGLVIGPDEALYFCEIDNHAIRRMDLKTKAVSLVVGDLKQPYEVRFDKAGNLFFADMPAHVVKRMDRRSKAITTIAGTGEPGYSGDGGPAAKSQLKQPHSITFDRDGRLLICDIGNHRVRRVDLKSGLIDTLPGADDRKVVNGPRAIDVAPDGTLYLALREGNAIYKIDTNMQYTRIAGTGQKGYSGDGGPAATATLNGPKGISLGPDGSVYIADTENHVIRKIDAKTGIITTVAGSGERGDGPDGDPLRCRMNRPHGIFVDKQGVVYIGDSEAHRIRVLR
jgi:streptogramin lyase